jgi:hypothetical protein
VLIFIPVRVQNPDRDLYPSTDLKIQSINKKSLPETYERR